jgi:hypothetical protein
MIVAHEKVVTCASGARRLDNAVCRIACTLVFLSALASRISQKSSRSMKQALRDRAERAVRCADGCSQVASEDTESRKEKYDQSLAPKWVTVNEKPRSLAGQ